VNAPDLTPRERASLRLSAAGYGNAQVARRLSVSRATVSNSLRQARAKLGAQNTAHACALGVHHGIVTAADLQEDA
jgi:DNA-binding CsgD family transcriptional regulator